MAGVEYLDFELNIGEGNDQIYPVRVRSLVGGTEITSVFPLTDVELEMQLLKLENALLRSVSRPREILTSLQVEVRYWGQQLFTFLFRDEIGNLYRECQQAAIHRQCGVRLKLQIQSPKLATLPWEFLYDPRKKDYICFQPHTPLVRYLDFPQSIQPLAVQPPLRILGMIASPNDLQPELNVKMERERLQRAVHTLQTKGLVDLIWLEGQTWHDLQRIMRSDYGPWHIFHFIGHGGFDPVQDEGLVMFDKGAEGADRISATQLSRLLARQQGSLRLVVLNSCEGARGGRMDVFSSTAAKLLHTGIPAVVAMQYAITDTAAIEFTSTFYEALADGLAIDTAVADARNAINLQDEHSIEWGTPVLYMRSPDGRIFDITSKATLGLSLPVEKISEAGITKMAAHSHVAEQHQTAVSLQEEVKRQSQISSAWQLAAQTIISIELKQDAELNLLLAIEAYRAAHDAGVHIWQVDDALRRAVASAPVAIFRHEAKVNQIDFSPDGLCLATASNNGTVHLFDINTGQERAPLKHEVSVIRIVFSSDGTRVATLCSDNTVYLWATNSGQQLTVIRHVDYVRWVFFSPDNARLITGCPGGIRGENKRGVVRLFDNNNGKELAVLIDNTVYIGDITFSPDSTRLVITFSQIRNNSVASLFDSASGKELATLIQCRSINSIAFSSDSARLAIGYDNYPKNNNDMARLFDSGNGKVLAILSHERAVKKITFSPDGSRLATACADNTISVWNPRDGQVLAVFNHKAQINDVAFSPDGSRLATLSGYEYDDSGIVRLFDNADNREITTLTYKPRIFMTEMKGAVFSTDGTRFATISDNSTVYLLNSVSGQILAFLRHKAWVSSISFSPDGTYLVVLCANNTVYIWDSINGQQLAILTHRKQIHNTVFSPNNIHLATASYDSTARLWNIRTGHEPIIIRHIPSKTSGNVAISPDNILLAVSTNENAVCIWNTITGQQQTVLKHERTVDKITFSPDGSRLATVCTDKTLSLWNPFNSQVLAVLKHEDEINGVVFSPDGSRLAMTSGASYPYSSGSRILRLFDSISGKELVTFKKSARGIFSPDGTRLAAINDDGSIHLEDSTNGQVLTILKNEVPITGITPDGGHEASWTSTILKQEVSITGITFSPDGSRLAATWGNPYSYSSGNRILRLFDSISGQIVAVLRHEAAITAIAFSPDSSRLATADSKGIVYLFDSISGQIVAVLKHEAAITAIAFSPDSSRLATACGAEFSWQNIIGAARLFDSASGKELALFKYEAKSNSAVFSSDSTRLATSSDDGTVHLLDSTDGQVLTILKHEAAITAIAFSPDGTRLAVASGYILSNESTIHLWNIDNSQSLAILRNEIHIDRMVFSPDGKRLITTSRDGKSYLWRVNLDELVLLACHIVSRDLTVQEWENYLGSNVPYRPTREGFK